MSLYCHERSVDSSVTRMFVVVITRMRTDPFILIQTNNRVNDDDITE